MGEEMWLLNFAYKASLFHACRILVNAVNLQNGAGGFIYPPKEVMLWIFIALESPLSSAGFEPVNLGPVQAHYQQLVSCCTLNLKRNAASFAKC
jgi:hypothetical protein